MCGWRILRESRPAPVFQSTFNLVPVLMFDNGNLVQETTLRHSFQNKLHCWLRIPDWYVLSPKHRSQTNSPPIIHDWKIISSYLIIITLDYHSISFHYFLLVSVIIPHYPHDIPTVFPYMSGPEKPSPSRLQTPPNPPESACWSSAPLPSNGQRPSSIT